MEYEEKVKNTRAKRDEIFRYQPMTIFYRVYTKESDR